MILYVIAGKCLRSDCWCFPMMSRWGGCFLIKERLPLWAWRGHCWPQFSRYQNTQWLLWSPVHLKMMGYQKNRDYARQIKISNEFWLRQCWDTPILWTAQTMSSLERGGTLCPFPCLFALLNLYLKDILFIFYSWNSFPESLPLVQKNALRILMCSQISSTGII